MQDNVEMRSKNRNLTAAKKQIAFLSGALMFAPFGLAADIHAQAGSFQTGNHASATLCISVTVMPIVQALSVTSQAAQKGAVTYNFDTTSREQTYEIRNLPQDKTANIESQSGAILKTLVVLPR
jgi:hypothetical protein